MLFDDAKIGEILRNRAEGLLYTTQRSLEEYNEQLDPADVEMIEVDVEALKAALERDDLPSIQSSFTALEASAYRIAETLYGSDGGAAQ